MTVKQAKNGSWFTQFRCKNKFGEEVHKCKRGFDTPEEAQAWEDDFIASAGCTMAMTFEEFYEVYKADVMPRIREHTWRNKEYLIKSKIMPHFKNCRMSDIQSIDIVRWQNDLMDGSNNKGKGYTQTYLRTVNNQLSAILNHAARYYGLHPNPTVRTMKMGGKETSEMQFWTKDEYLSMRHVFPTKVQLFFPSESTADAGLIRTRWQQTDDVTRDEITSSQLNKQRCRVGIASREITP